MALSVAAGRYALAMKAAAVCIFVFLATMALSASAQEPVVGGPCEGCETVFVGQPKNLDWKAPIASPAEAGERLRLEGVVRNAAGTPVANVIVYAYQTDSTGVYPPGATRHGRLRAWVRTDDRGRYRFDTVMPGSYPGRDEPRHIHLHIIEPGRATYYIDSVHFADDPLLTAERRKRLRQRGGSGVTTRTGNASTGWRAKRDITLGQNVPGYRQR